MSFQSRINGMGDDFGIRIGSETVTCAFQLRLERLVIFNNAIMDDCDMIATDMRMGIALFRRSMGCPARVGDACMSGKPAQTGDLLCQLLDLAQCPHPVQLASLINDRHPGGVIAPIFKAPQTFQQHWHHIMAGNPTNDPTH